MNFEHWIPAAHELVVVGKIHGFEPTQIFGRARLEESIMQSLNPAEVSVLAPSHVISAYNNFHAANIPRIALPRNFKWTALIKINDSILTEKHIGDIFSRTLQHVRDYVGHYDFQVGRKSPTLIKWREGDKEHKHAMGIVVTAAVGERLAAHNRRFAVKIEPLGAITRGGLFQGSDMFYFNEDELTLELY